MTVALRSIALRGISNLSLTCIHKSDHGKEPSRDTAHSVRDEVVAGLVSFMHPMVAGLGRLPLATKLPKKQNAKSANKTDAAAFDPVPW